MKCGHASPDTCANKLGVVLADPVPSPDNIAD